MMMGATNSRSLQTSAPGYRLHKETRPWATRDVNNPLPEGGEKEEKIMEQRLFAQMGSSSARSRTWLGALHQGGRIKDE
jgi:hypothetical protein